MKDTSDITSREYKMVRRDKTLSCSFCKPHRGENATHRKRSVKKPRKHRQGIQHG